jgi:hypothetical protein
VLWLYDCNPFSIDAPFHKRIVISSQDSSNKLNDG